MNLNTVLLKFHNVEEHDGGRYYTARCSAHDDHKNSLTITPTDDKILICCHANCTFGEILTKAGLRPDDLRNGHHRNGYHQNGNGHKPTIKAVYDYRGPDGQLLYQSVRYEPKDFKQRQPDGSGGYIWSLTKPPVERVLYRLPELIASDPSQLVFIVEGEKDADRLAKLELVATTNVSGAGKWKPEYNQWLKARIVIILPDNDQPGRDHAQRVCQALTGYAASVKILELPGLPEKGDVSDWLNAGHTKEDLLQLTQEPKPEPYFKRLSLSELMARPPKDWLIEGFLGKGDYGMIFGDSGTGKTFAVISLIFSGVTGRKFANRFNISRPLSIAYCAGEGISGLPQRFSAAGSYFEASRPEVCQLVNDNLHLFLNIPQLFDEEAQSSIYTFIGDWQDSGLGQLDLLVIDTLHAASFGADEDRAKDAGLILKALKAARDTLGCAVLLVHHANRQGNYRGSSALHGAMDLMAQTKKVNSVFQLEHFKLKDEDPFKPLHFHLAPDLDNGSVYAEWVEETVTKLDEEGKKSGKKDQAKREILGLLTQEPGLSQTDITNRLGIGRNTVIEALNEMETEEQINSQVDSGDKNKKRYYPAIHF